MAKSNKFDTVKEFYDKGFWDLYRCKMAVVKGWITAEEFQEITGEGYEN